jgi:hypothetical protein
MPTTSVECEMLPPYYSPGVVATITLSKGKDFFLACDIIQHKNILKSRMEGYLRGGILYFRIISGVNFA